MAELTVLEADITQQEVDAIVNAANDRLWMGGGVAGAIKRAGGQEIEDEAVRKGPVKVGEAVVTGAGRLRARYVIHAVTMGQDLQTSAEIIREATRSALRRAAELNLRSVAMPALGTGVGGFPLGACAKIMVETAREETRDTSIERVIFVVRGEEARRAFAAALA
jgi:O-acetyl-ADP-ribose deacetylase (regulator of RNase III)